MMLRPLMEKYSSFILTEQTKYDIGEGMQIYYLKQVNRRELSFLPRMLLNSVTSIRVFLREQPDVVVSTGALATIPMCFMCKVAKRKLVYIESFAKVVSPTKTGKLLYRWADRFYVQWESMRSVYPKAVYVGGIY